MLTHDLTFSSHFSTVEARTIIELFAMVMQISTIVPNYLDFGTSYDPVWVEYLKGGIWK